MQSTNPSLHQYASPYIGPAPQPMAVSNPANQQPVPHVHAVAYPSGSWSRQSLEGQVRSELYAAGVSAKATETLAGLAAGLDAVLFEPDALIPLQLTALSPQLNAVVAARLAANLSNPFKGMPTVNMAELNQAMRTISDLEKALRNARSAQAETVGAIWMTIENLLEFLELSKSTAVAGTDRLIDLDGDNLAGDDPETLQQARSALLDNVATGVIRIGVSTAAKLSMLSAMPTPGTAGFSAMRAPWLDPAPRIVAPGSAPQFPGAAVGMQHQAVPVAYPAPQPMPYPTGVHAQVRNDLIYQQQPLPMSTDAATSFLPSSAQTWQSVGQQPVAFATPTVQAPDPGTKAEPATPVPDPAPQLTPRSSKKPGRLKQLMQKLSISKPKGSADARQGTQPDKKNVGDAGGHDSWDSDDADSDHDENDDGAKASPASALVESENRHDSVSEDSIDGDATPGVPHDQVEGGGMALQQHKDGVPIFCTPGMLLNLLRAYNYKKQRSALKKVIALLELLPPNQSALIPDLIEAMVSKAGTSRIDRAALRKAAQTLLKHNYQNHPLHILASEILEALKK
ncbi:polyadenylate binding domain-containing protein [Noviherbaspirillum pedocola]|uniref:Uncharacterized protein n=1 Tax=Noviherbaspirillum pedocola TaxID=2801341 RepID=A0A934SVT3_9BURK|nr:hypothetical protein [Noviherbaspirillum pedocola]MBK4736293.1 hypothetical protein [Noviherbaspirillum pedocola]